MSKQTHFESIMEALQQVEEFEKGNEFMGRLQVVTIPDIEPVEEYSKEKIKEIHQRT